MWGDMPREWHHSKSVFLRSRVRVRPWQADCAVEDGPTLEYLDSTSGVRKLNNPQKPSQKCGDGGWVRLELGREENSDYNQNNMKYICSCVCMYMHIKIHIYICISER